MSNESDYYRKLEEDLVQLERTDPKVKAAAISYDRGIRRILEGRSHPLPCRNADCEWHHPKDDQE